MTMSIHPTSRLRCSLYIGFALFFGFITLLLLPTQRWSSSNIVFLQEAVVDEVDIRPNAAIVIMISPRRLTGAHFVLMDAYFQ